MDGLLASHAALFQAFGAAGVLLLLQLLVADVAGIRAGHVPGAPVDADHGRFLFRAVRAHANTNESLAAFALIGLFGVAAGASPAWLGGAAWVYVGARLGHMLCYYVNWRLARSIAFGIGVAALLAMFAAGVFA